MFADDIGSSAEVAVFEWPGQKKTSTLYKPSDVLASGRIVRGRFVAVYNALYKPYMDLGHNAGSNQGLPTVPLLTERVKRYLSLKWTKRLLGCALPPNTKHRH